MRCAQYFAMQASGGSAHYCLDHETGVQSVKEAAIAWHAPPNSHSIGLEMCDMVLWNQGGGHNAGEYQKEFAGNEAAFHARWSLPKWDALLRRTASVTRYLCLKYNVPMVKLSPADLLAGRRGICGHIDVSLAWHQTDHSDPGPDFPWARFMAYVTGGVAPPPPPTQPEDDMSWDTTFDNDLNPATAGQPAWTVLRDARVLAEQARDAANQTSAKVDALAARVNSTPPPPPAVNLDALAAAVVAHMGDDFAAKVIDALGERINSAAKP
jgi:hypothetical protein